MIVVSDATPIISLLKIGRLELLRKHFGEILIPEIVFSELTINERFSEEADVINRCEFILKKTVSGADVKKMQKETGLDAGESAAIVLCGDMGADLLLMDEARGRKVAREMGKKIMGTVGLLMVSYEKGFLSADEIKEAVTVLRKEERRIGERYYQMLLERMQGD